MPELKHNFLRGKMNKDLDERLVPNGQYRDALNIEVLTSEGSEAGTVQNLKGNTLATVQDQNYTNTQLDLSDNATTVGSYVDQSSKSIFNFINKASDLVANGVYGANVRRTGVVSDVITHYTALSSAEKGVVYPLVTDVYESRLIANAQDGVGDTFITFPASSTTTYGTNYSGSPLYYPTGVREGMVVELFSPSGFNFYNPNDIVTVVKVLPSDDASSVKVSISKPLGAMYYSDALIDQGYTVRFTSKKILNFQSGIDEIEYNVNNTPTSPTPENTMITGINYVNGILFYTDGRNEPKRVVIERFYNPNGSYITSASIKNHSRWNRGSNTEKGYLTEDVITTIRRNPTTPPLVTPKFTTRSPEYILDSDGVATSHLYAPSVTSIVSEWDTATDTFDNFALSDGENVKYPPGTQFYIYATTARVHWKVNDVINITGGSSAASATIRITEHYSGGPEAWTVFQVELIDVDESYVGTEADEAWVGVLREKQSLYIDSFISFAYRYKYVDGEYSCISPYSNTMFMPSFYAYSATKGFNKGMESLAKQITVSDFVTTNTPIDVDSIDIILKDSSSGNAQIIKEVKRYSSEWEDTSPEQHSNGKIIIDTETYGSLIPSDQLLRNFDAVPKTAKAQEFSSSRLLYANYKEGFDILDHNKTVINPVLSCGMATIPNDFSSAITGSNNLDASLTSGIDIYPNLYEGDTSSEDLDNFDYPYEFGNPMVFKYINANATTLGGTGFDARHWPGYAIIPADSEFDPGSAWNQDRMYYTIPELGSYSITASTKFCFIYQAFTSSSSANAGIAKLVVCKVNAQGQPLTIDSSQVGVNSLDILINGGQEFSPNLGTNNTLSAMTTAFDDLDPSTTLSLSGTLSTTSGQINVGDRLGVFLVTTNNFQGDGSGGAFNTSASGTLAETTTDTSSSVVDISLWRGLKLKDCSINVEAPETVTEIITKQAVSSVKSSRTYEVGVVYLDGKGRESSVLLDDNIGLKNELDNSKNKTRIKVKIFNNAPYWAEYYKFFIREIGPEYNNIVLYKAYPNDIAATDVTETVYAWLAFNSVDRNKISKQDYLLLKKKHGENEAVVDLDARFRVLDIVDSASTIVDDAATEELESGFSLKGIKIDATVEDVSGKFFVKVEMDDIFEEYIGDAESAVASESVNNGALFEVEKPLNVDLDLFYEASQAYPIKLTKEKLGTFIKNKSKATVTNVAELADFNSIVTSAYQTIPTGSNTIIHPWVYGNVGAIGGDDSFINGHNVMVLLDSPLVTSLDVSESAPLEIKFENKDGGSVTALCTSVEAEGFVLRIYPYTHRLSHGGGALNTSSTITLPWFNCFAFGNGVESDRIRDDFNGKSIFPYSANGKQSGFKASTFVAGYSETQMHNDIIFSQIHNDATKVARYNEFIFADNITKKLNSEYGSIQKLYTRNSDLIAFCENKILQILANKDALFNADGSSQLLSSTNVLGLAKPFGGDFGISTNPESFASEEYRIYFTDKNKGAVLRLSMDGITPISDSGMKDWFNDNLEQATSVVGSYDGKKGEYNVTVHSSTNPGYKKNVYTVSYSEAAKGWTSFKSFILESGLSMNNEYYTFKNGDMYLHHPDQTSVDRNNFYGIQYNSTLDALFNDSPGFVKLFKTVNYEGTQSKEL